VNWVKHDDYAIFREINVRLHSPFLDPISTLLSYSGLGISLFLFFIFLAVFKATRAFVLPLLSTLLLSGGILADAIFKQLIPRDRPSNLDFSIPEEAHRWSSFPSGHTSVSFGTAFTILFMTWNTPQRKWGWAAMAWAFGVGLSRIYRGVHWPTDVLAGFFVGLLSASVVVLIFNGIESRKLTRKERTPKPSPSQS
jgi:undecaprenyl-diphosphatase